MVIRDVPSYGTRCIRRTSKRILHKKQTRKTEVSKATKRRDAKWLRRTRPIPLPGEYPRTMRKTGGTREWKAENGPMQGMCVVLAHRALDLEERQTNARLPRLGLFQDEVVHGLAQGGVGAVVGICGEYFARSNAG